MQSQLDREVEERVRMVLFHEWWTIYQSQLAEIDRIRERRRRWLLAVGAGSFDGDTPASAWDFAARSTLLVEPQRSADVKRQKRLEWAERQVQVAAAELVKRGWWAP